MWVRGLKLCASAVNDKSQPSHPMWVRGLKPMSVEGRPSPDVAPYVGAWIET